MTNKLLVSVMINGRPNLLKFMETPGSPVVVVEFPTAMDLIMDPRGGECIPGLSHPVVNAYYPWDGLKAIEEIVLEPSLDQTIQGEIIAIGEEAWKKFQADGYPFQRPVDWDTMVKASVSKFLAYGETAKRIAEAASGVTVSKEQLYSTKHLEGTSQLERSGELGKFLSYITDSENVWDKEKYVASRRVSGTVFGQEADFRYMYVLGNAFLEGHIGDSKVRIYYLKLQGFQIYLGPLGEPLDQHGQRPITYHPDDKAGVLAYFEELSIKR
jgi:hypothetical protein